MLFCPITVLKWPVLVKRIQTRPLHPAAMWTQLIPATLSSVLAALLCCPPRPAPGSWSCPWRLQKRRVLGNLGLRVESLQSWPLMRIMSRALYRPLRAANWWRLWTWMTELIVCEQWQGMVKGYWCHKIWIPLFLGPSGGTTGAGGTQDSASDLEKLPQFMK